MAHPLSTILLGLWLTLISWPATAAPFCNIFGTSGNGVEFSLAMEGAEHITGSDYTPNALLLKNPSNGEIKDYSARHCLVHFFDPKSQIYLEQMHIRCSRDGRHLRGTLYKYRYEKQAFVCTQGCSKNSPKAFEFELCN